MEAAQSEYRLLNEHQELKEGKVGQGDIELSEMSTDLFQY